MYSVVATKLTQPMQFPTHMVPTPNHAMMTPNYMMNQKMYPQSAPVGFHPPPEFPQQNKDHIEINKHGGISVYFEYSKSPSKTTFLNGLNQKNIKRTIILL